jgi:predicted N-acetyltransferase YhbS
MTTEIRRLREKDAETVSSIVRRNFLEVNVKDYPIEEMEKLAALYDAAKIREMSKWAHSYVAVADGEVAGCGSITRHWNQEDKSVLLTIFVLPELHGKGIGTQIVRTLEQDEYFLRVKSVEIPASITGCDFYRKLGYDYKDGIKRVDEEGHIWLENLFYSDIIAQFSPPASPLGTQRKVGSHW